MIKLYFARRSYNLLSKCGADTVLMLLLQVIMMMIIAAALKTLLFLSLRAHRALINVWIPSVFLQGRAANAYHVYQVNFLDGVTI